MTVPTQNAPVPADPLTAAWQNRDPIDLLGPDPITFDGDPDTGWQPNQQIAATTLAALMRKPVAADASTTPALTILGARVTGQLELPDAAITTRITFDNCLFDHPINLRGATTKTLHFTECQIPYLDASETQIHGELGLERSRISKINLFAAHITGNLQMGGAQLTTSSGQIALEATNLTVGADMLCEAWDHPDGSVTPFNATGQVNLYGAKITGNLVMAGAQLTPGPGQIALEATNLTVGADMLCEAWDHPDGSVTPFNATGQVNLYGANIGRNLQMGGAQLTTSSGQIALEATNLTVGADMLCQAWDHPDGSVTPFNATGQVNLYDADIGRNLQMGGAQLTTSSGQIALKATNLTVGADMLCQAWDHPDGSVTPFNATGQVNLPGANIGRNLMMGGAQLTTSSDQTALEATNLTVGADMLCQAWDPPDGSVTPFNATGQVSLYGAKITGNLVMGGAQLTTSSGQTALEATNLTVGADMLCQAWDHPDGSVTPFNATGQVTLDGAKITGNLMMGGVQLTPGPGQIALEATNLTVGADMLCQAWDHPDGSVTPFNASGQVSLPGANIGRNLVMGGARLTPGPGQIALEATNLTVGADMLCQARDHPDGSVTPFNATGQVSLYGAKITGNLQMDGAQLTPGPDQTALEATNLTVGADMLCQAWNHPDGSVTPFNAIGKISLPGAKITGNLQMDGAQLTTDGTLPALLLANAEIHQDAFFGPAGTSDGLKFVRDDRGHLAVPFTAAGGISVADAHIGMSLYLDGAALSNPAGGACLDGERLHVERDLRCGVLTNIYDETPAVNPKDGASAPVFTYDTFVRLAHANIGGLLNLDGACYQPTAAVKRSPANGDKGKAGQVILTGATVGVLTHQRPQPPKTRTPAVPARLVIDQLSYSNLEPLQPARTRLAWLADGLTDGHRPQPFEQLAGYYRRLGHDHDARTVLQAKRKAQTKNAAGPSALLSKPGGAILNALSGYGYRPARAFAWLTVSLTIGYLVFSRHQPANITEPFDRVLYTLDLVIPTSPFGLESVPLPDTIAYWTANALKALGWILSLAVLPAITRGLSRD